MSCQAALALGRLRAETALACLERVLMSDHTPLLLRMDTVRALTWYCDRTPAHTAFHVLHQALMTFGSVREPSPETRKIVLALIHALGELHHSPLVTQAAQCLTDYLKTPQLSTELLQASIMALADLGQPHTFDALVPLLIHPIDLIPGHTIAALKRLDPINGRRRVIEALAPEDQATILDLW